MRTVARSKDVSGDRVAETLLAISEGDLVVRRFSWTDGGEDRPYKILVVFSLVQGTRGSPFRSEIFILNIA